MKYLSCYISTALEIWWNIFPLIMCPCEDKTRPCHRGIITPLKWYENILFERNVVIQIHGPCCMDLNEVCTGLIIVQRRAINFELVWTVQAEVNCWGIDTNCGTFVLLFLRYWMYWDFYFFELLIFFHVIIKASILLCTHEFLIIKI
jgi:hypothetical protein